MANILRLTVACVLFAVSLAAAAAFSPTVEYRLQAPQYNYDSGWVSGAQAACDGVAAVVGRQAGISVFGELVDSQCTVWPQNRFSQYGSWTVTTRSECSLGGVKNESGQCVCLSPLTQVGDQCKLPACPTGQHEEGGACVPNACNPNEVRVNGVCVPEPPCPEGQARVNGQCKPSQCKPGAYGPYYDVPDRSPFSECYTNPDNGQSCMVGSDTWFEAKKDGNVVKRTAGTKFTGKSCTPAPASGDTGTPGGSNGTGTGTGIGTGIAMGIGIGSGDGGMACTLIGVHTLKAVCALTGEGGNTSSSCV